MPTITSSNITIADSGEVDNAHIITLTPQVAPYPTNVWYRSSNGYFSDLVWDDATNNYVVVKSSFRTQLQL